MLPAERRLFDHALTFLSEMLISDNVEVGYALFDQLTLGSKLASINDANRRVLFEGEFSWGQAAYLDVALAAAIETVAILVELELESPIDDVSWRELVSDAVDERESNAGSGQPLSFACESALLSSIFLERYSGFRDDEAASVLDSEPGVANEVKGQMGLPIDYYTRIPVDPNVGEVRELLAAIFA